MSDVWCWGVEAFVAWWCVVTLLPGSGVRGTVRP